MKSILKSFENIGFVPTDVSPPNTPNPDTPFPFIHHSGSDEDIFENNVLNEYIIWSNFDLFYVIVFFCG